MTLNSVRDGLGRERKSDFQLVADGANTYKIQSREKSHGGAARKILGTCILPAPGGIGDQHSCSWGPDNMDPASLAIANATFEALSKPGGVNEKASEMIDRVKKAGADI